MRLRGLVMLPTYVLGVDPGPIPGVVALSITDGRLQAVQVFQVAPAGYTLPLVGWLIDCAQPTARTVLAIERFVVGPRAARSSSPKAGQITRDLVGALQTVAELKGVEVVLRPAAAVMPWATDKRLEAADLLDLTKGMQHARAAARHALFAATADCGLPDPLSKRGPTP
jgi:hypothetical protein